MTTHTKTENQQDDLEKLISDYGPSKYNDIVRAMQWARHLRRQEEFRNVPMAELIDRALLDIVSGKVKVEEIEEAIKKDLALMERLDAKRSDETRRPRAVKEESPAKEAA